jgi:N-acetylglucosamine kinase-like BadF-type ATPase
VLSQTYSTSVGIVVRGTGELFFPVNDEVVLLEDGEVILTTMLDGANGCVAIGSTGSLMVEVARSDKSFALNKPWSIAAN